MAWEWVAPLCTAATGIIGLVYTRKAAADGRAHAEQVQRDGLKHSEQVAKQAQDRAADLETARRRSDRLERVSVEMLFVAQELDRAVGTMYAALEAARASNFAEPPADASYDQVRMRMAFDRVRSDAFAEVMLYCSKSARTAYSAHQATIGKINKELQSIIHRLIEEAPNVTDEVRIEVEAVLDLRAELAETLHTLTDRLREDLGHEGLYWAKADRR